MGKYSELKSERNYIKRLSANVATRFADSIDQITFGWIMYEITGSASLLALILFFNFLPTIILPPFLGVLVENRSKKLIIACCDFGRTVIVIFTLIAYTLNWLNAPLLILITLCISTMEAFNRPASTSFYPALLSPDKYESAVALDTSVSRIAELLGVGAAGFLISLLGVQGALIVDLSFFLISAAITITMRVQEEVKKEKLNIKSYFEQLFDGFRILRSLKVVCFFIFLSTSLNFFISPLNAFQSAYVADNLNAGPEIVSAIGAAITLGLGIGSILVPNIRGKLSARPLFIICGTLQAFSMFGYFLIPGISSFPLKIIAILFATFLFGFCLGIYIVIVSTKILSDIPKEYLSRVYGVCTSLSTLTVPFGALICSGLSLVMPVPAIYMLFGAVMLVFYLIVSSSKYLQYM
jgi:Na+/melibiose symporter and related transporters